VNLAPLLVRPGEAARLLGVCERTVWELTARGTLPAVRIGRAVWYAVDDLKVFSDRHKDN